MTAPSGGPWRYRHLGGGRGEIEPPEGVAERFGDVWDVRCFLWTGSEYWAAQRHRPAPAAARAFGVRDRCIGWSDPARMLSWLTAQGSAWEQWEAALLIHALRESWAMPLPGQRRNGRPADRGDGPRAEPRLSGHLRVTHE